MGNESILKKYFEGQECERSYQEKRLCHTYFFKEFHVYPSVLNIKHDDYLTSIKTFHDPILTYVALYLYHNYGIAQKYFKTKSNTSQKDNRYDNVACSVLNRWLDQEKNFYTNFGRCYYNLRWWNIHIKPLWDKLKGYYNDKICERIDSYYFKEAFLNKPKERDRCYEQQPEDYVCYNGNDKKSKQENCDKLSILFYLGEKYKLFGQRTGESNTTSNQYCPNAPEKPEKINYNPVLKAEKSHFCQPLTSTITLPTIVTVLGTIFLVFFLNEFTHIGSKLQTPYKNNVRLSEHFNEEAAYEEYESYRHNSQNTAREKNIIYYQSMNE